MKYQLIKLLKERGYVPKRNGGEWEQLVEDIVALILKEQKEDLQSVLNMLEGDTDRGQVVNYIKKYLA